MSNKKTLKIGRSDFELIVKNNHYFVDKTMLIYEFYHNENDIILMPRPKRFGKTLNLSMIEHFFDIQKPESKKLFSEYKISEKKEFCLEHQNKYPVINISLKDIKKTSWNKCLENFKDAIYELYQEHKYLLQSNKLDSSEKKHFRDIISKTALETDYETSLFKLSKYLKTHFDNDVIILVDEYDAPIINAFKNTPAPIKTEKGKNTYYQNVVDFMQTFLGKAYKGNKNLKIGLLTGVMRVGKESIFSEWNNFAVFGITSPYFAENFGFTQSETQKILTYFNLQNHINKISEWYNGYKFGDIDKIYNPWAIVNYISRYKEGFISYWVNSGDDSLIKERIAEPNIKDKVQELIAGKTIVKTIRENFVFPDFEHKTELLWTLLFYSGFLTKVKKISRNQYELKIPNYEIKFVFIDIILDWIENEYKINQDLLITTSNNLINNNLIDFETGFKKILNDTLSYFDIAPVKDKDNKEIKIPQEQFFHVYTLGLLAVLSDDYIIKSNRESGEGRYDIVLIPHNKNNNGIIIEIKHIENQQKNETYDKFIKRINGKIDEALEQIQRKKYYKELLSHKVELDKIIRVPIVFAGKEPYITKLPE